MENLNGPEKRPPLRDTILQPVFDGPTADHRCSTVNVHSLVNQLAVPNGPSNMSSATRPQ